MHDCTAKTPCIKTTEADAEAKTRANPSLALIQESVIVKASESVAETEPKSISTDDCLYCASLSVEMKKRAEPTAKVLEVGAVVAVGEIALPVLALEAAGAGVTTLGIETASLDTAVIGSELNTAVYAGQAGFNVLRASSWAWEAANVPWLNGGIRAGQSVIVLGGNKFTQQEVQYLMEQAKYMWNSGFDKLVPPH